MKFTWKIFVSTLFIVLFSLSVGGTMIISVSFNNSLENEIMGLRKENRMMGMGIVSLMNYYNQSPYQEERIAIKDVLEALGDSWSSDGKEYQILSNDNEILGGNISGEAIQFKHDLSEDKYTYTILKEGDQYFIQAANQLNLREGFITIVSRYNISQIFLTRKEQTDTFSKVMFAIGGFSAVLNAGLAVWLTRSVYHLAKVSQALSEGDMKIRVKIVSKDEIGLLSRHFNEMANSLEEKINQLEDAARRQEDFVGSFTHEIKTPLTSMIGYADLLRSHNLDESTRFEAANYIFHEGKRLESLSLKLLEYLVEGKKELLIKKISLFQLVDNTLTSIRPSLEEKNIEIKNEVLEHTILGDQELIKIVILNVIDNARKAVEHGGIIRITSKKSNNYVVLSVIDNGRGIPKKDLGRITDAFYMVDKSRARDEGGAGIGLAICARIMNLHHGEIQFESEIDKGTKVHLIFHQRAQLSKEEGE